MPTPPLNKGRLINFLTGISGVAPGGNALINIPTNQRIHRIVFSCFAVNYSGSASGIATVGISTAGTGLVIASTVTNGVVTNVTVGTGGTGYAVGDTFTYADPTGAGFVGRVSAVAGGVVTAITITSGGTATAISPTTFFTSLKIQVNGVNMRDISPASIIGICTMNGWPPQIGQLPIYFTEPWRNIIRHNELTSWDLFNQGTCQITAQISPTVSLPVLTGFIEFDYMRNGRVSMVNGKQQMVYFLMPVSHHQFTQQLVSGRNDVNQLPWTNPISRIWIAGADPGNIYQLEVYQDGNKVLEATTAQIMEAYAEYGIGFQPYPQNDFTIVNNGVVIGTYPKATTIPNGLVQANAFDVAFISDPDQRIFKSLKCASSLNVRVYCYVAQAVTFVMETLPGAYSA